MGTATSPIAMKNRCRVKLSPNLDNPGFRESRNEQWMPTTNMAKRKLVQ